MVRDLLPPRHQQPYVITPRTPLLRRHPRRELRGTRNASSAVTVPSPTTPTRPAPDRPAPTPPATAPRTARSPAADPAGAGTWAPHSPEAVADRRRPVPPPHRDRSACLPDRPPTPEAPAPPPPAPRQLVECRLRRPVTAPGLVRLRRRIRTHHHDRARRRGPQQWQRPCTRPSAATRLVSSACRSPSSGSASSRTSGSAPRRRPPAPAVPGVRDIPGHRDHSPPVPRQLLRRPLQHPGGPGVQHQIPAPLRECRASARPSPFEAPVIIATGMTTVPLLRRQGPMNPRHSQRRNAPTRRASAVSRTPQGTST